MLKKLRYLGVIVMLLGVLSACGEPNQINEIPKEDVMEKIAELNKEIVFKDKTICINPGHQKKGNTELELMSPISDVKKQKLVAVQVVKKRTIYKLQKT